MDLEQKIINQAKNIVSQIKSDCFISNHNIIQLYNIISNIISHNHQKPWYRTIQFYYVSHSKYQLILNCFCDEYKFLYIVNELQKRRNIFEKITSSLGLHSQEIKSILNDKQFPVSDSFFIYNAYLIQSYFNCTNYSKEFIFNADKLKKQSHNYVRYLIINENYGIKNFRKLILDCHNLIQLDIYDCEKKSSSFKSSEFLKLMHEINPRVRISIELCYQMQINFFTNIDDQTLKNLNLQSLQFYSWQSLKSDFNILKQIQKIDKLRKIHFKIIRNTLITKNECLEIGICIGNCTNLINLKFNISFLLDQELLFQGIKNLKNLQYLDLRLSFPPLDLHNQIMSLNQIVEIIVDCQNLIELVLVGFNSNNQEYFTEILPKQLSNLKKLITFYINYHNYNRFKIKNLKQRLQQLLYDLQDFKKEIFESFKQYISELKCLFEIYTTL